MNVNTVSTFLAVLAIDAELGALAGLVFIVGGGPSATIARARQWVVSLIGPTALFLGFAVAAVSMAGSLYFSEVADFTPCNLCWYQRICMYPLVPLLGIAALRRDVTIRPYAVVLAGTGALISSYHVLVEHYPSLESDVCDPTNPCTLIWVEKFGYLTIPTMALSGFAFILVLLAAATRPRERV